MAAASALLAAALLCAPQDTELERFQSALERRDAPALAAWYESTPRWGFLRSSRVVSEGLESPTDERAARARLVAEALADAPPGPLFARALRWSDGDRERYRVLAADLRALQGLPPDAELDGLLAELRELGAEAFLLKPLSGVARRLLDAGQAERAHALVARALEVAHEVGAVWTEAWAAEWLGRERWQRGALAEAAALLGRAAELDRLFGDAAYRTRLLADLATVELSRGELAAGMRATDEARALADELGDPALLRRVRYVQAGTHLDLGELQTALAICLELAPDSGDDADAMQVRLDLLAANILSDVGRLESAISFAERALSRAAGADAADRAPLANEARLTLGLYLGDAGRAAAGLALLDEADEGFCASGDRRGQGWAQKNRGWVLARSGDVDGALAAFAAGRALGRETASPFLEGWCALGTAEADPEGERFDDAIETAQRVAARLRDRHLAWRAAAAVGRRHLARGELEAALAGFERAVEGIERWRRRLDAPGLLVHFLREKSDPYREAAFTAARLGRVETAFAHAGLLRARVLSESRGRRDVVVRGAEDPRLHELRLRMAGAEARLRDTALAAEERGSAAAELERAEAELDRLLVAATLEQPAARRGVAPPDVAELRARLGASDLDVIVSYLVGEDGTLAFVLRSESLSLEILPVGGARLAAWVGRLRAPTEALNRGELDLAHLGFDVEAARALHGALVEPLGLRSGESVGVVADGVLAALPFEALVVAGEPGPVDTARPFAALESLVFLGERHRLSLLASLDPGRAWRAPRAGDELVAFVAPPEVGVGGSAREVEALRRAAGALELRVVERARPGDVAAHGAGAFALHLVAHGIADALLPAHSHLLFGRSERLEAWRVETLDLSRVQLAVLSACHTAEGSWYSGEGRQDLSRSFLLAGAARVVASRWAVDDRATALLMELFYDELGRGAPSAEALRAACARLRTARDPRGLSLAHPYFWAAWAVER